jgi:hypothetical protein
MTIAEESRLASRVELSGIEPLTSSVPSTVGLGRPPRPESQSIRWRSYGAGYGSSDW